MLLAILCIAMLITAMHCHAMLFWQQLAPEGFLGRAGRDHGQLLQVASGSSRWWRIIGYKLQAYNILITIYLNKMIA